MAGRFGYTGPTNGDAFDVPGDLTDSYAFWDARVSETVATAASLPAASARPAGHVISVQDIPSIYLALGTAGGAGTSWILVWVFYDWTTLAAASGWTANTGGSAPQVAREGRTVFFRGGFFGGTANTTATTVPAWARPSRVSRLAFAKLDNTLGYVRVFTGGDLQPSGDISPEATVQWTVT